MVTKIIAVGDIHIRNIRRNEEYQKKLSLFIDKCKNIVKENGAENTRIVVAGDILHNKTDISPEAYLMASWFLRELGKICKTIVFAGNHDKSENLQRLDPLTTIFSMGIDNVVYLDSVSGYESACVNDENITWCLYSSFSQLSRPNIETARIENPNNTLVGLFHGTIKGSRTDAGYQSETGVSDSHFGGLDFGILGHIHKRQCIEFEGVPLVYCGSLIQQDFGENLSGHGFVVWDIENKTYEEKSFEDDEYGFYTFSINSETDIDNNVEELLNL